MIGAAAYHIYQKGIVADLDLNGKSQMDIEMYRE